MPYRAGIRRGSIREVKLTKTRVSEAEETAVGSVDDGVDDVGQGARANFSLEEEEEEEEIRLKLSSKERT